MVSSRKDAKAQRTPLDIKENIIAKQVVDAAYQIHSKIGPGLFESVYEVLLAHELTKRGFVIERQKLISILYNGMVFDEGFRADLVVEDLIILELKSVETILPVHKKQLLTYLRLTDKKLGLLINFGSALIKDGIFRIVNNL
jgi:GxxExxY protein